MGRQATGRYAQAISDRSGQAFPYKEMVKEWTGAFVHISEFEPKHPQLNPRNPGADAQGLKNARPQRPDLTSSFTLYITNDSFSMLPSSSDNILGTELTSFSATSEVGTVTIGIS